MPDQKGCERVEVFFGLCNDLLDGISCMAS
jgi:hypothetical protein